MRRKVIEQILANMSADQILAIREGRVRDCHVDHPVGTRCPNCANWPFKKGGASQFVAAAQKHLDDTK